MSKGMEPAASSIWQPLWLTIIGWCCAGLIGAALTFSAVMKFLQPADMLKEMDKIQLDPKLLVPIGILEITCTLIYLFPRTAVLGAVLVTGYLGGAILTHVRTHDYNIVPHIIMGVIMWLGIYLREPRLRAIMPWR